MRFENEEKAIKELQCYMYCLDKHVREFEKENYIESAVYLENASRSLKALEELKVDEKQSDHVVNVFVISRSFDGNY